MTLASRSALELAGAIRRGEVSSVEVVRVHLARIAERNPALNAVVALAPDRALAEARRADRARARGDPLPPLHGVPFTVKDTIDTAGVVTTWGTAGCARRVPDADATVVARLRDAGGILLGKTNVSELAMSYETDNALHGATRNPYDPARSPGGSSGGAAAAVAACLTPLDVGTDAAGSLRIPAHFCGVAAVKPTAGRVPQTGQSGGLASHVAALAQTGPIGRRVADVAAALAVICGPDGVDPGVAPVPLGRHEDVPIGGLRVGVVRHNGLDAPDAATAATLDDAARALAERGATVRDAAPPGLDRAPDIVSQLIVGDGGAWIARLLDAVGTRESTFGRFPIREPVGADRYVELLQESARFRAELLAFARDLDVLLAPVTAAPAPPLGTIGVAARPAGFTYPHPFNLAGWPVAVVRCGTSPEGLPIGVQVAAHPWREDVALAAAAALEDALGGWRPPR
ncbi:MAG: amidase [Actinomycetota bacterium]